MKWKNLIKVAYKSIIKNRMRSLLTSLGIIIGVGAVIVMVAIGQGAQERIKNEISQLGTNLIIVFPSASRVGGVSRGAGSFNRFKMEDVEALREQTTLLSGVSEVVRSGGQVIGGGNNWSTQIMGVAPDYLTIRDWPLASGEFFTEREIRSMAKVAVLGNQVAENLFPGEDPVGERIRIRNIPFKVIGLLASKGQSAMGSDQDDIILAPSSTILYRMKGGINIDMIIASAISLKEIGPAQEEIRDILRESHKLLPGDEDDFTVRTQAEITEAASETSRVLTLLLGAVAGVSLVVGGIGIMNIMLVSVTERTREIGIRLSIGAREGDIRNQFLTEAVVLSLTGGILGILMAALVAFVVSRVTDLTTLINPAIVILAFVFSGSVGVFFGYYPARKAATLNPIDALRHE